MASRDEDERAVPAAYRTDRYGEADQLGQRGRLVPPLVSQFA
jgi:hypothetical protein